MKPMTNGSSERAVITMNRVSKTFTRGGESISVLSDLNLEVDQGSFEAIMGPSGSGKTTLLNLMAGIETPTSGRIIVAGCDLSTMSQSELAKFRARHVAFIFQTYNLIPVLTALENVELPLSLAKVASSERRRRAQTALEVVGLSQRQGHYPRQLSGGQEQRVAVARAIVADPTLLIADEPTGDLDRKSAEEILTLLEKLNREMKKTIIMVTHDPRAAERARMTHYIDKGALVPSNDFDRHGGTQFEARDRVAS